MTYFQSRIDYIYFFYGLSFFLLATVCFYLRKEKDETTAWSWLGFFGLAHGLTEWMDLVALTFQGNFFSSVSRTAVMALSYLFLLEFGRRTLKKSGAKVPGAWIGALLLPALAGWHYGHNGLNAAVRYALGLPAALLSAWAIYRVAGGKPAGPRQPLLAISAVLVLYALAAGGVVPESEFIPARWFNYGAFIKVFGFPVQLLRGLLASFAAACAWIYMLNLEADRDAGRKNGKKTLVGLAAMAVLLVMTAGWAWTDFIGNRVQKETFFESESMDAGLTCRFKDAMRDSGRAAAAMAVSPLLADVLANGNRGNLAGAGSLLDNYCGMFKLSACFLVDLKGAVIVSSGSNEPVIQADPNHVQMPILRKIAAGKPGSDFSFCEDKQQDYYFGSPVNKNGRVIGTVIVRNDLGELAGELLSLPYAFVISPEGVIHLSSRPDLLSRALWPVDAAACESPAGANRSGLPGFKAVLKSEIRDDEILKFSDDRFYVSRTPLNERGWSLVILHSLRHVLLARFAGILLTFSICLLLLVFTAALLHEETARETAEKVLRLKEEIKTLSGILPICSGCKKIRDETGQWNGLETYVAEHTKAQFSHCACPDCIKRIYPEHSPRPL